MTLLVQQERGARGLPAPLTLCANPKRFTINVRRHKEGTASQLMTVENPKVIDFVGIDKQNGECVLGISDHLGWADGDGHLFGGDKDRADLSTLTVQPFSVFMRLNLTLGE